jgi:hypothetical protein
MQESWSLRRLEPVPARKRRLWTWGIQPRRPRSLGTVMEAAGHTPGLSRKPGARSELLLRPIQGLTLE